MKHWLERLRAAHWLEILLLVVLFAVMALLALREAPARNSGSERECQMATLLSAVEGAGEVHVMLLEDADSGELRGAAIAAQGADSVAVRLRLQSAVRVLTGLELDKIEVLDGGG